MPYVVLMVEFPHGSCAILFPGKPEATPYEQNLARGNNRISERDWHLVDIGDRKLRGVEVQRLCPILRQKLRPQPTLQTLGGHFPESNSKVEVAAAGCRALRTGSIKPKDFNRSVRRREICEALND
ncbi:MAG: hypothetical protein WD005_02085, partial [Haliea sp.]